MLGKLEFDDMNIAHYGGYEIEIIEDGGTDAFGNFGYIISKDGELVKEMYGFDFREQVDAEVEEVLKSLV